LRYSDRLGGFGEEALEQASAGREVLEVRDHFFMRGDVPHLVLVLVLGAENEPPRRRAPAEDPGKALPPQLQALYRDLRQWRNERAKTEGIPSYVIMRNVLVVEICRRLPRSLAELKEIDGIGDGTCAKYGREILGMIPEDLSGEAERETAPDSPGERTVPGPASEGGEP